MTDDWKCGTCGIGAYEHGRMDTQCLWNPVPIDSTPAVIEQALLLGDQIEEVDRTIRQYEIAWSNHTPDFYGLRPSMRRREFTGTKGFRVLSDYRESLRKKMADLDFDPEYDRLRERVMEAAHQRQQEAHDSYLDKKDNA